MSFGGTDLEVAVQEDEVSTEIVDENKVLFERPLPDDMHSMYLMLPMVHPKRQHFLDSFTDVDRAWQEYQSFVEDVLANGSETARWTRVGVEDEEEGEDVQFVVDWSLIERCLAVHDPDYQSTDKAPLSLLEYLHQIDQFIASLPSKPVKIILPTYQILQDKDELKEEDLHVIDFRLFALRRVLLYAPYNCIYYRIKNLQPELNPSSQFNSKSLPGITSYGQYIEEKYGERIQDWTQPLVEVRRVENFADLVNWTVVMQSTEDESAPDRRKKFTPSAAAKRRREAIAQGEDGSNNSSRSVLISELALVSPLPYSLVRMAMLIPRLVHDLDRQCTIQRYFHQVIQVPGLRLPHMVTALTGPTAALPYDYERLEILGDSFLKYTSTVDVYVQYGSYGEGHLSATRQTIISNNNLSKIGMRLEVHKWATLTPFFAKLWTAPTLLSVLEQHMVQKQSSMDDKNYQQKVDRYFEMCSQLFEPWCRWRRVAEVEARSSNRDKVYKLIGDKLIAPPQKGEVEEGSKKNNELRLRRYGQVLPNKCVADMIESIIAVLLLDLGPDAAINWMQREGILSKSMLKDQLTTFAKQNPIDVLGLGSEGVGQSRTGVSAERMWVKDKRVGGAARFCDAELMIMSKDKSSKTSTPSGPIPLVHKSSDVSNVLPSVPTEDKFAFDQLEALLNYRFRERRLLFIACTHVSVDPIFCNERLEWLGDAALDWLVTRHYWHGYGHLTPAQLTETRQSAVNNNTFARIAVLSGLHPFLRIDATFLQLDIQQYVSDIENPPKRDAPKCLGDLLEAIAGALLIDCRFEDDVFVQAFTPLLTPHIRPPTETIQDGIMGVSNPIRTFLYTFSCFGIPRTSISFIYHDLLPEDTSSHLTQSKCQIIVKGRLVAEAIGNTRAVAKRHASTCALEYIRTGDNWKQYL